MFWVAPRDPQECLAFGRGDQVLDEREGVRRERDSRMTPHFEMMLGSGHAIRTMSDEARQRTKYSRRPRSVVMNRISFGLNVPRKRQIGLWSLPESVQALAIIRVYTSSSYHHVGPLVEPQNSQYELSR